MTTTITRLARLLQLASPALPVGAYSYSGGLEAAVEAGIVRDAASAERWIGDVLDLSIARMEAPILVRMLRDGAQRWNALFLSSRETAELQAETVQMGYSLDRLTRELGLTGLEFAEASFPAAFANVAKQWEIEPRDALAAYLWAWVENQVLAAVKAVPLGQTAGQRILKVLGDRISVSIENILKIGDDELENFTPGLAMLSSRHEMQYSRLFRS